MAEWNKLPQTLKLHIAASAMEQATESLAVFAETLAGEMDDDELSGPDMLRLFAGMVRAAHGQNAVAAVGRA